VNAVVYTAKVEKITDPAKAAEVCDKCSDERKGQPIVGMTIMRGVKQDADDKGLWDGGDILDPKNGKVYKVRLKPIDGARSWKCVATSVRRCSAAPRPGFASSKTPKEKQ
jgi:uncharacterized protein (DUF2147 family)